MFNFFAAIKERIAAYAKSTSSLNPPLDLNPSMIFELISNKEITKSEETIKKQEEKLKEKINEYKKLGKRERITLHTSYDLFVRYEGCTIYEVKQLLNELTLQGSVPEPLRVSQLLANSLLQKGLSF